MKKNTGESNEADLTPRIAFVDVEASGLIEGGFPIEIGWVDREGHGESHLIRPAPGWTAWSWEAEKVHGISCQQLEREGEPYGEVARRVIAALGSATVYSDAPEFDGPWIRMLLDVAGVGADLALVDAEEALSLATRPLNALITSPPKSLKRIWQSYEVSKLGSKILNAAFNHAEAVAPRTHRALADARHLWTIWYEIERLVAEQTRQNLRP